MDDMANHATRIRRAMDRHGVEPVEAFIDLALSLDNLIDPHAPFIVRERSDEPDEPARPVAQRMKSKSYMADYINPPHLIAAEQKRLEAEAAALRHKFPMQEVRDILRFLIDHAPLENWQRDVLAIVRDEAYYFAPQAQTKIMNEGWATYWHSKIMTEKMLTDSAGGRAVPRHRGSLEPRPLRQGVRRVRRHPGARPLGSRPGARARQDLRGPEGLHRRHLHRRLPDRGVLPVAEAVQLRPQPQDRHVPDQ
jgi:stage V sporulation protein R